MPLEEDPVSWLERRPDERLLGPDLAQLPESVSHPPEPLPESPARRQLVRLGATLTGVTLVGGLALVVLGGVELIASGGLAWGIALVLGVILAGTHWGWVHVAELTGNQIEARRAAPLEERCLQWLEQIEPYPRWEVSTIVGQDGSITITTVRHRPETAGEHKFTFLRETVAQEVHSADEPAAAVAERAELLRREAAAWTSQSQERYQKARVAYEHALLARDDEEQRTAALRAASEALSERINANLRDPPLIE